ncbi:F-box protein [Rhodotorula paludigena]|uniref:F-box protein n=1 Tax=Rhodotorula paludigena TaxID=86838 RepID=UPI0031745952
MAPSLRPSTSHSTSMSKAKVDVPPSKADKGKNKEADEIEDDDEESDAPRPPKKRKSGKKGARGRAATRGNDLFSSLPFDLLYQICGLVDPATLLSISQTSKAVHRTLDSKASEPVWVAARRSVGMPDLEADLAEPMYAFLVQGKACQICGTTKRKTEVDHYVRVRACKAHLSENLRVETDIRKRHSSLHPSSFACSLSTEWNAQGNLRADGELHYWEPDVLATSQRLHSLEGSGKGEQATTSQTSVLTQFYNERSKLRVDVAKDAKTIFAFELRSVDDNLKEDEVKTKTRRKAIFAKLAELGYDERDYRDLHKFLSSAQPAVTSPKELTEREWSRIRPKILTEVDRQKSARLLHEEQDRRSRRRGALRPLYNQLFMAASPVQQQAFPSFEAFTTFDDVKVLWQPAEAVVDPKTWPALKLELAVEIEAIRQQDKFSYFDMIGQQLLDRGVQLNRPIKRAIEKEPIAFVDGPNGRVLAPLHAKLPDEQVDAVLALALSLLECNACLLKLPYSDLAAHFRSVHPHSRPSSRLAPESFFRAIDGMLYNAKYDADTTTIDEMLQLGAVFTVHFSDGTEAVGKSWRQVTRGTIAVPQAQSWASPRLYKAKDVTWLSIDQDLVNASAEK